MTDYQENKLSMFIAVRNFINANETKLSTLPSFSTIREQFENVVDSLLSISADQKEIRTGYATDKAQIKEELISQAIDLSKKLAAYAQLAGNNTLKEAVAFAKSKLRYATDSELRQYCDKIWERANENQENLEAFDVSESVVEAFKNQLTDFTEAMPRPKNALKDRKLITGTLKSLFDDGDGLLRDKIDFLLETVEKSDLALYNAYRSARATSKEYGSRHRAVTVTVTNIAGIPLHKAEVTIVGSPITKKTSEKGGFYINSMPAGIYTFNFSKTGYKSVSKTVIVSEGEAAKVDVVMEGVLMGVGV